jgi:hypothetical protein
VATAQLVVASRRVRQILLLYISPLYRCASKPSSAAVNGSLGFCTALMSLPPLKVRLEIRKRKTRVSVRNCGIGCQCAMEDPFSRAGGSYKSVTHISGGHGSWEADWQRADLRGLVLPGQTGRVGSPSRPFRRVQVRRSAWRCGSGRTKSNHNL